MAVLLKIHPQNPELRKIQRVATDVLAGKVIAYPTDSGYALGCQIGDKAAIERIRKIRQLGKAHHFTLVCRDLSELASYALVTNSVFRLLKAYTPGAYTFLLEASKQVPRRLQHPKRKTIGLRVPDYPITREILEAINQPLISVTLTLPDEEYPMTDPDEIFDRLKWQVDLVVDGGVGSLEPTSVIDLTSGVPEVLRKGKGDTTPFG